MRRAVPPAIVALVLAACGATTTVDEQPEQTAALDEATTAAATTTDTQKPTKAKTYAVARVIDGDTIELKNGKRVRLVQIDSPETQEGECYSQEATAVLSAILPKGTKVTLEADPKLDKVDQYDRLLRYVFKGKKNVNLVLVQRGAASVWFYESDKGRYAQPLMKAAKQAKKAGRGLWGACPAAVLDPSRAVETGPERAPTESQAPPAAETAAPEASADCHPSYEGACLDPSASDYDCAGGSGNGPKYTGPVRVVGPDVFDLDRDGDGIGCE